MLYRETKKVKENITKIMFDKGINLKDLSKITKINVVSLKLMLYCPYCKLKLYKTLLICQALKINISEVMV